MDLRYLQDSYLPSPTILKLRKLRKGIKNIVGKGVSQFCGCKGQNPDLTITFPSASQNHKIFCEKAWIELCKGQDS